jgi:signal recognition particle subunit SRP54
VDDKALARTEAIILSMTPEERENPSLLNSSRKKRIAAGSGNSVVDINRLLKQFEGIQAMMKQFSGGKLPRGLRGRMGSLRGLPF